MDLKIYVPKSLKIDESALQSEIKNAQRIFLAAGIRLNFGPLTPVDITIADLSMTGHGPEKRSKAGEKNFYKKLEQEKHTLSDQALKVFSSLVKDENTADRTIHIILLKELNSIFYVGQKKKSFATGAQSFPPYLLQDRIPRKLRGVISLQEFTGRNLAHELGHKLINVSHEWRHIGPQMEIVAEGGLMLYGQGEEIPKGLTGRWHYERLHLSPFIYQLQKGKKVWNPDYENNGTYNDAIYKSFVADDPI